MTVNQLKGTIDSLKTVAFPDHPESDALDEWILELAEADGYIAGIAISVASGSDPTTFSVSGLDSLSNSLRDISVSNNTDDVTYSQCIRYLESLKVVRNALIDAGCKAASDA